jgi:hypothetical protein
MSNWNYTFLYDERFITFFREQGYPHPPLSARNRLPTLADFQWAFAQHPTLMVEERLPYIDLRDPSIEPSTETLRDWTWEEGDLMAPCDPCVRSIGLITLTVFKTLCQQCGQLCLVPDTGHAWLIIDATIDVSRVCALWQQSQAQPSDTAWQWLYTQLYGPGY